MAGHFGCRRVPNPGPECGALSPGRRGLACLAMILLDSSLGEDPSESRAGVHGSGEAQPDLGSASDERRFSFDQLAP